MAFPHCQLHFRFSFRAVRVATSQQQVGQSGSCIYH